MVPSPSVSSIHLFERPEISSALFGWTSSGRPKRVRPEIPKEKLFPIGDSDLSSRLLYVMSAVVLSPRPAEENGVHLNREFPLATFVRWPIPAPTSSPSYW